MTVNKSNDAALVWMSGSYSVDDIFLTSAIIREGLSKLTETTIEFRAESNKVDLGKLIGRTMNVHLLLKDGKSERKFTGTCISVEALGVMQGKERFVAEVRPWFWMLTRTRNSRIFQEKTSIDIIKDVMNEHGFSVTDSKLSGNYETREYCVQYRESDYDFICRLLEEEGVYYFFDNALDQTDPEEMILADGIGAHSSAKDADNLEFNDRDNVDWRSEDHIVEWADERRVTRGKMTFNDYDLMTPKADLQVSNAIEQGDHDHKKYEDYDHTGHYRRNTGQGDQLVRVRMESEALNHETMRGATSVRTLSAGYTCTMNKHPMKHLNTEYLLTEVVHYLQDISEIVEDPPRRDVQPRNSEIPEDMIGETYANVISAIPSQTQFRPPQKTPWPEISGVHTATVIGNQAGDEIVTDEYGRIKVYFHWDRIGRESFDNDRHSDILACWVRVVTPWSGTGWGMVAVPRVGQEVVIQFEEGNPDRPMCTGMLYNDINQPSHFNYPDEATKLGIRTNSSKGGEGFNELMFDDKKDEEFMNVQAQKDHQFLVKNKSVVTIGQDEVDAGAHDEDGSLSEVIRNHVTRTIQEGNHHLTIEQGDEEFKIETGSQNIEIATDKTQKITKNYTTKVTQGDIDVKVDMGKSTTEAMQSIELKVGASSIKIEPAAITIKSPTINIEGVAKATMKSPITTVQASGIMTVKGSLTKIN